MKQKNLIAWKIGTRVKTKHTNRLGTIVPKKYEGSNKIVNVKYDIERHGVGEKPFIATALKKDLIKI